ncbi:MAG: hypothetical protein WDW38_009651 [Sanguina aurantia]
MKTTIGSGIMTLPRALQLMGVLPGVSFILLVAAVMSFSLSILVAGATATREATYFRSVEVLVGRRSAHLLQALIIMYTAGSTITNQIIIADVLIGAAAYPDGLLPLWVGAWEGAAAGVMMTRWFVLLVLMVTVIGPMCFTKTAVAVKSLSHQPLAGRSPVFRHHLFDRHRHRVQPSDGHAPHRRRMSSLRYSSVVGVLLAIMFALATLALACAAHAQGLVKPLHLLPHPLPRSVRSGSSSLGSNITDTANPGSSGLGPGTFGSDVAGSSQSGPGSIATPGTTPPDPTAGGGGSARASSGTSTPASGRGTPPPRNLFGALFRGAAAATAPSLHAPQAHALPNALRAPTTSQLLADSSSSSSGTAVHGGRHAGGASQGDPHPPSPAPNTGPARAPAAAPTGVRHWLRRWMTSGSHPYPPQQTGAGSGSLPPPPMGQDMPGSPAPPKRHSRRWESLVRQAHQGGSDAAAAAAAAATHSRALLSREAGLQAGEDAHSSGGASDCDIANDGCSGGSSSGGGGVGSGREDDQQQVRQVGSVRRIQAAAAASGFGPAQQSRMAHDGSPPVPPVGAGVQAPCVEQGPLRTRSFATWFVGGARPPCSVASDADGREEVGTGMEGAGVGAAGGNAGGEDEQAMVPDLAEGVGRKGRSFGVGGGDGGGGSSSSALAGSSIGGVSVGSPPAGKSSGLELLVNVFSAMPVIVNSFVSHFNLHPIMIELAAPSPATMVSVVETSNAVAALTYLVTALAGYITFADTTRENLLKNFEPTSLAPITGEFTAHVLSAIVRIGYAIVLLTSYPLVHFALRARILEALDHATGRPQRPPSSANDSSPSRGSGPLPDPHHTPATPHVTLALPTSDADGWPSPHVPSRRKSLASTIKSLDMQAGNGVNSSDRSSLERGNDSEREPYMDERTLHKALRRSEDAATVQGRARQRGDKGSSLALASTTSFPRSGSTARLLSAHQEVLRGKRAPASLTPTPSPSQGQLYNGGGSNLRPAPRGLVSSTAEARRSASNLDQWPDLSKRARTPSSSSARSSRARCPGLLRCLCPCVASVVSSSLASRITSPLSARCRSCGACAASLCGCGPSTACKRPSLLRRLKHVTLSVRQLLLTRPWQLFTFPWRLVTSPWPWHRLQHQSDSFWNQLTLVTLVISYFAAIWIPDIWVVQRVNGCTGAVAMSFVFPALMAMHLNPHSTKIKVMSVLLLMVGGTLAY